MVSYVTSGWKGGEGTACGRWDARPDIPRAQRIGAPGTAPVHAETSGGGAFVRQPNRFTGRVTPHSTSPPGGGPDEQGRWPLEAGRYRLIWCRACPWAHRARIVRSLLGLDDVISLGTVDPIRDERGWRFALDPDGFDPALASASSPGIPGDRPRLHGGGDRAGCWSTRDGQVVTNGLPAAHARPVHRVAAGCTPRSRRSSTPWSCDRSWTR